MIYELSEKEAIEYLQDFSIYGYSKFSIMQKNKKIKSDCCIAKLSFMIWELAELFDNCREHQVTLFICSKCETTCHPKNMENFKTKKIAIDIRKNGTNNLIWA